MQVFWCYDYVSHDRLPYQHRIQKVLLYNIVYTNFTYISVCLETQAN